jgi:hypothetical protein
MITKVKEYFNGSMEPEPASVRKEQATDMDLAVRFFQTFGISIVLKAQDQILQRISGANITQRQPAIEERN